MVDLVAAINAGDVDALASRLSDENVFRTVGVAPPQGLTGPATLERADVLEYFKARNSAGEIYRLAEMTVRSEVGGASSTGSGIVRVDFLGVRTANDIDGEIAIRGYAEVDCPSVQVYVMSVGEKHPSEDVDSWCPDPSGSEDDTIVACATEG